MGKGGGCVRREGIKNVRKMDLLMDNEETKVVEATPISAPQKAAAFQLTGSRR